MPYPHLIRAVLFPAAALAVLTFCSTDNNRRGSETGMAEGGAGGFSVHDTMPSSASDTASGGGLGTSPAAILSQLDVANTAEIQLSKMAWKTASSPAVKRLAAKLAADHAQNREEERALAQKLGISLTSGAGGEISSTKGAAVPPELQGKIGRDFDKAFVDLEIKKHQDTIEKIRSQLLPAAQNSELKAYLQKTLTDMQAHLASLKQVQQQLG
jgi:putative membrane protein